MANHPFFADAVIIASLAAVNTYIGASGKLEIYAGTQPTDANTAITTQTLLSTLTFGSTAFGTPVASGSAGSKIVTATANTIASDTSAAGTGTASWFRCYKSDGTTVVMDGSVDTSGADLNLNTTSIVAGATVSCTSFTLTQAE